MSQVAIPLKLVALALGARKIAAYQRRSDPATGCRWAAMSAHVETQTCSTSQHRYHFAKPAMLVPMYSGRLENVVRRVRQREGLNGVKRTWGFGLRAMLEATASEVMR